MGTSASSSGQGGGTPLVPGWLGGPEPTPSATPAQMPPSSAPDGQPPPSSPAPPSLPPTQPIDTSRFQRARRNFTKFAASGGEDRRALSRAVRSYVSRANGGSGNASRRMGSSRRAAAVLAGVFGQLASDGADATFRSLNLDVALTGDIAAALLALTDVICGDGGLVDEAIARDAWCDVVADIDAIGVTSLDSIDDTQRKAIFAAFVAKTIERRILNDIGSSGFRVAGSPTEIRQVHEELASYIQSATKDEISACLPNDLKGLSPAKLDAIGREVYDIAWSILETYEATDASP